MGKTSRRKGRAYEQEIAKKLRDWKIDENAKRHLEFQFQEAEEGRDIDTILPFAIQCKHWKSTPSISAMDQIQVSDSYPLRLCILKRSQKKDVKSLEVAVVDLDVMLTMIMVLQDEELLGDVVELCG